MRSITAGSSMTAIGHIVALQRGPANVHRTNNLHAPAPASVPRPPRPPTEKPIERKLEGLPELRVEDTGTGPKGRG